MVLREVGISSLVNMSTQLRGVLPLVGVDDLRAGNLDLPQALRGIEAQTPQIILSHNPRILPLLQERDCLILSGHTHAGQVHLPFTKFRMRPTGIMKAARGFTSIRVWEACTSRCVFAARRKFRFLPCGEQRRRCLKVLASVRNAGTRITNEY
jgi:hypothetical protein